MGSGWVTRTRSGELWRELHNGGKDSGVEAARSTGAMGKRPNPCSLWFFKQGDNVHPWTGYRRIRFHTGEASFYLLRESQSFP